MACSLFVGEHVVRAEGHAQFVYESPGGRLALLDQHFLSFLQTMLAVGFRLLDGKRSALLRPRSGLFIAVCSAIARQHILETVDCS